MSNLLPDELKQLIEAFHRNREQYRNPNYNEASLRQDFLDECIRLLGWDVGNKARNAESFKEVVVESRLDIDGASKAPDYCVQYGGRKLFFVEAKKPSVNIGTDTKAAFQVRRYGWSANMPLCILTDFEEWSVYDTTIKPSSKDKAHDGRIFYCQYDQLDRPDLNSNGMTGWEYLYSLFSKEAVLKGSLERAKNIKRHGTITVDAEFLNDIEQWRIILAKDIAKNNPDLNERELNFAVQTTIDRIIFLRICEDRGIEREDQLATIIQKPNVYNSLKDLFQAADTRYNSGLFHFRKSDGADFDKLTLTLTISDNALRSMIRGLYFPAPYQFAQMPASILGSVYERFLGKTIQLNARHHAKIEEKPEVRKAGGVYYTPEYIVDYIVKNTIGEQLKNKTVKNIGNFSVVDCACGSGSFLIVAYQYLLDWYLKEYLKDVQLYDKKKRITKVGDGYKLTIKERKRILTTHIFGVDIDAQAVEVTKLSLLLNTLENINEQEVSMTLAVERLLPNLSNNIKSGNSLIGTDFYTQTTMDLDDQEQYKINAFDWEKEFASVFARGGFDAVIGNPPYIFTRGHGFSEWEKEYYVKTYTHQNYQLNTYALFLEKCCEHLLAPKGRLGFIIPNNLLTISSMKPFRDYLIGHYGDVQIVNNMYKVFAQAKVDTCIFFVSKKPAGGGVQLFVQNKPQEYEFIGTIKPKDIISRPVVSFSKSDKLLEKIEKVSVSLEKLAVVKSGFKAYEVGKGTPVQTDAMKKQRVYHDTVQKTSEYRRYLDGRDVCRYHIEWGGAWVLYGKNLAAPRASDLYEGQRILVRQIPNRHPYLINAAFTDADWTNDMNSMIIKPLSCNLKFILGILNSKLMSFWFDKKFQKMQRGIFPQFKVSELKTFPIVKTAAQKNVVALVERMIKLKQQEVVARDTHTRAVLGRQISALDDAIDKEVYQLYKLTDAEIAIIEGNH